MKTSSEVQEAQLETAAPSLTDIKTVIKFSEAWQSWAFF